jgi:hypothetical protein
LKVDEGVSGREDGSRGPNKAPSKFQPDTCTTALCCIRRAFTAHPAFQRSVSLPPRSPLYYRFALKNPKITAPCPVAASTFTSVFVLVQGIGFWDKVQIVMCRARLGSLGLDREKAVSASSTYTTSCTSTYATSCTSTYATSCASTYTMSCTSTSLSSS